MQLKLWMAGLLAAMLLAGQTRAEESKTAQASAEKKSEPKKDEKKKDDKKKDDKKDDKKPESKDGLKGEEVLSYPAPVATTWMARCKHVLNPVAKEVKEGIEFTGADQWNEKIKLVIALNGKLIKEDDRKLPLTSVPKPVVDTAKKWAPTARWNDVAKVETKDGQLPVYEITGDLNGKKVEAKIREDGTVAKADKLEGDEAKEEKKSDKKDEKK
jgi:hypothetical protein